jgi:hypothetical protein
MCSAVTTIAGYLFPPFPPLHERAARWLESDLARPDPPPSWFALLLESIDEEQIPP